MNLRGQQLPPANNDWLTWVLLGGRGSGKTRAGAEWVHGMANGFAPFASHAISPLALIGGTFADVREIMVEGPAGIVRSAQFARPVWEASRKRLVWPNGAVAHAFSAEDPESLRGPQFAAAWFTEIGCPAVDKGATRPNVFFDPKSSESALPWHSTGARDDDQQRAYLMAHYAVWKEIAAHNPNSSSYGGPMVDFDRMYLWAWDARPLPAFPINDAQWGDSANWLRGHWLNGRLGTASALELAGAILDDFGFARPEISQLSGNVQGALFSAPATAREQLEPVLALFDLVANDGEAADDAALSIKPADCLTPVPVASENLVSRFPEADRKVQRFEAREFPSQIVVSFADSITDYAASTVYSRRIEFVSANSAHHSPPFFLDRSEAKNRAERILSTTWNNRQSQSLELPLRHAGLEVGDVICFTDQPEELQIIEQLSSGEKLEVTTRSFGKYGANRALPLLPGYKANAAGEGLFGGQPEFAFLDLPNWGGSDDIDQFRVAAYAVPATPLTVLASPVSQDFSTRASLSGRARIGALTVALEGLFSGRIDHSRVIEVTLPFGRFESREIEPVLNGANAIAIRSREGQWEVVQFLDAEEIEPHTWLLSNLLRGQAGTEDATLTGADAGAPVVLLNPDVSPAGLASTEVGLDLTWRIGTSGREFSDRYFTTSIERGGLRALTPLSPVHLSWEQLQTGAARLQWIRRTRRGGDSWLGLDVPLSEDEERYRVTISSLADDVLSDTTVSEPGLDLDPSSVAALPDTVSVAIAQISQAVGDGIAAKRTFTVR